MNLQANILNNKYQREVQQCHSPSNCISVAKKNWATNHIDWWGDGQLSQRETGQQEGSWVAYSPFIVWERSLRVGEKRVALAKANLL